ncbi:hypothetical protein QE152_g4163 [Popillia japonica]|uniref:Uncharacterized protein n=1 Tax=Popillia japonica TaxID=7064 RepID=A0AAW1N2G7_POPJA
MTTYTDKTVAINHEYQSEISRHICEIFKCNFNYVKAIRLFSEGGNGAVNLCTTACKILGNLEKRYKRKITTMTQNNESACSNCLQVLGEAKFKVNDFLSKYEGELKHYDAYTYALKDIQVEIKKEVYHVKFKTKQLCSALENLWQIGAHSIGDSHKIELFVKQAGKFVQLIEECENILRRPASLTELLMYSKTTISRNPSVTTLPAKIGKMQSKIKSSLLFADYSSYLFEVPPVNEECFIGKIQYLLFTSYKNIQSEAQYVLPAVVVSGLGSAARQQRSRTNLKELTVLVHQQNTCAVVNRRCHIIQTILHAIG